LIESHLALAALAGLAERGERQASMPPGACECVSRVFCTLDRAGSLCRQCFVRWLAEQPTAHVRPRYLDGRR